MSATNYAEMLNELRDDADTPHPSWTTDQDRVEYVHHEASRWTKYGHDRLYFNGEHDGYIDLQTGSVEGDTPVVRVEVEDGKVVYYVEDIDYQYEIAKVPVGGV